jgi:transcriptional regulator with XRE-family HTH domain
MNIRKVVGDNLRFCRQQRNWTQGELAEKTGLSQDYIGRLERGNENISIDTLSKIATIFKENISDLLTEDFCVSKEWVANKSTVRSF